MGGYGKTDNLIIAAILALAVAVQAVPVRFNAEGDLDTAAQTFARAVLSSDDSLSQPIPYSFKHESSTEEGTHTHEESGDGNGRVTGSYTLTLADGRQRTVRYTADETGFHPEIVTNEQGTESNNPADASITSSALSGPDAAHAAEPERLRLLASGGFKSKA
ncbi:uncharacterized protein [Dermacentor andersoni]|uniref:uncharacterized protein isoform X1 n=1 Tax=Dermacentor andersoni TaxID=34620 RepID=UPI0024180803|nr:cuticle protein 10.9-like isoform X1 [Dermacentor andersoni]